MFFANPLNKFQLHHTGIKTTAFSLFSSSAHSFQLHHTGIKTPVICVFPVLSAAFQLHHTGIKMYPLYYSQKLTTSFGVIWLVF